MFVYVWIYICHMDVGGEEEALNETVITSGYKALDLGAPN